MVRAFTIIYIFVKLELQSLRLTGLQIIHETIELANWLQRGIHRLPEVKSNFVSMHTRGWHPNRSREVEVTVAQVSGELLQRVIGKIQLVKQLAHNVQLECEWMCEEY